MTSVLRELPLSYAVLPKGHRCGSASVVREPSPAEPSYRASSTAPAGPSARATPRRRSRARVFSLARTAASQAGPEGHEAASRAVRGPPHLRALSLRCSAEEAVQDRRDPRRRTGLGTATASLRPRPDRRVTRRLCRRGSPRPGEAGRWDVEPRAKGVAVALRSRGRAWPEQPHRGRTRIHQWMPGVERRESPCRCPAGIQVEMRASTRGCRPPLADDGAAVQ